MNGGKEPLENAHTFKLILQSIFSVLPEVAILVTNGYFWQYLASNHNIKFYQTQYSL